MMDILETSAEQPPELAAKAASVPAERTARSLWQWVLSANTAVNTASNFVSVIISFLVVLLVVAEVILRKFFDFSIPGVYGMGKAALVGIVFLALAYTQRTGGHIRVTVVTDRFPSRVRVLANSFTALLGVVMYSLFTRYTWAAALASYKVREFEPGIWDLPMYPARFVLTFGCFLLTVQFLLEFITSVPAVFRPGVQARDSSILTREEPGGVV